MVQTPENLKKCLSNFKKDIIPLLLAYLQTKNNGEILFVKRNVFLFAILFHFLIYKLFVHISCSSIGTFTTDETEINIGLYIPIWVDDQLTTCVASEPPWSRWAILAYCVMVVWLSPWTKLRNHTVLFTLSSHSEDAGQRSRE